MPLERKGKGRMRTATLLRNGSLPAAAIVLSLLTLTGVTFPNTKRVLWLHEGPAPKFQQVRRAYLNRLARPFVDDLSRKEYFLWDLVQQIHDELQARGVDGWERSKVGFDLVYHFADSLTGVYNQELNGLLNVAKQLDQLEREARARQRLDLVWAIRDVRERIARALDGEWQSADLERRLELLRRMNHEMDRIVSDYNQLEALRRRANELGRYDLVPDIEAAEATLMSAVTQWGESAPVDRDVVTEYMAELSKLVRVLYQLDDLAAKAEQVAPDLIPLINQAKGSIIGNLDERVLEAFGYQLFSHSEKVKLSDFIEEWKKLQWAEHEADATFYEVIYRKLIETATPKERERMLRRALESGVEAYAAQRFALAELHFGHVLSCYDGWGFDLTPTRYYHAECLYALQRYDEAAQEYEKLMRSPEPNEFAGLAAVRLLAMAHLGVNVDVDAATRALGLSATKLSREDRAAGFFLAGLWYLENGDAVAAKAALEQVPKKSRLALRAKFVLGVALVSLEGNESAKRIFSEIAAYKNKPGRGYFEAMLANASLVKLGLIAFQEGDMKQAVKYFESVSEDFPGYDEALLGEAWARLKMGDYQGAIGPAEKLGNQYVQSQYTYEALVLEAHCKRIIGKKDEALQALRFVANARRVEDLAREYARERKILASMQVQLDSLERTIIERGDANLYPKLLEAKDQTEFALWLLEHPGSFGARMMEEFDNERLRMFRLMEQAEKLALAARKLGRKDVVHKADRVEHRLLRALETYQADRNITRVNQFVDYPLALREATSRYEAALLDSLREESARETAALWSIRAQMDSLRKRAKELGVHDVAFESEYWVEQLSDVGKNLSQVRGWLASRDVRVIDADFNRWADFSGFGMSDIALSSLRERQRQMSRYSQYVQAVGTLLRQRKEQLEADLRDLQRRIQQLEYEWQQLRLAEAKKNQEKYFESEYFDKQTTEVPAETKDQPNITNPDEPQKQDKGDGADGSKSQ